MDTTGKDWRSDAPLLRTERLLLRALALSDAPRVKQLAGHPDIAAVTTNIPHPYPVALAERWIASHEPNRRAGRSLELGIEHRSMLVGSVSLMNMAEGRANVGYWLGVDFWGRGLMTEAVTALAEYAFETIGLQELRAIHMWRNPASGRVLQKAGFRRIGAEQRTLNGRIEDVVLYRRRRGKMRL